MVLSETFWIAFVSTMSASCLVTVRWCYRSKCTNVKCCGIEIQRDVAGEESLDRFQPPSPPSQSDKNNGTISL